jgi:peptide/nickel transport system substrate-binding protein
VKPQLVIAYGAPAEQQNVPYPQSQVSEKLNGQYDHLIGRGILTNEEQPELATSWSVGSNGKDWTFNLKSGVPFYKDGKAIPGYTFTSKDLALTWDLLTGEGGTYSTKDSRSPGEWTARLGGPSNWEFPNDTTAIVHAPNVILDLGFFMSDEWESGVMSIQHWNAVGGEAAYKNDPVGNGPWTHIKSVINQEWHHKRVENHYRKTPEFHERRILLINEAATRMAALLAKEVDIIPLVRSQRNQVTSAGFKTSASTFPSVHQGISFIYYREDVYCKDGKVLPGSGVPNCGKSPGGYDPNDPLRKPEVRLALNHALDRNAINTAFYQGLGFPLVDYFPPWRSDFKDAWAPHPGPQGKTGKEGGYPYNYDVAKAKQLLTQAGFPNGFNTILNCLRTHAVIPEWPDICEKVRQDFAAIGVNAELEFVNAFGEFRNIARSRSRPNWMWSASPSLDPICHAVEFSLIWELGIGYREYEEASDFYAKCQQVTTFAERDKISQEFGDQWVAKAFTAPLFWVTAEVAYNPGVVAEYTVNMLHMGPVRYHEYTKAVTQ